MIESMAQLAGTALAGQGRSGLVVLGGVDKARFRRVVRPGDEIQLQATIEHLGGRAVTVTANGQLDSKLACSARMLFVAVEDEGRSR